MQHNHQQLAEKLKYFDFDISKITNFWLDEMNFEGVVVFKDKPDAFFKEHYHNDDDYLFMLEGSMAIETLGQTITLNKGDFAIFPKKQVHNARIEKLGAKYLAGTPKGDFDSVYAN